MKCSMQDRVMITRSRLNMIWRQVRELRRLKYSVSDNEGLAKLKNVGSTYIDFLNGRNGSLRVSLN
jgi:hypothetical protein